MGLFNEAKKYGGSFYRSFSQSHGSEDLDFYFQDDPVIQQGICAGSSLDWLEYYLTLSDDDHQKYSNDIMKQNRNKIITIQRGLRHRDQTLSDLLLLYGLKPHDNLPFKYKFDITNSKDVAKLSASASGVNVISYTDPQQGKHVAVFYVDEDKNLFFMDTQKGDVSIPYPGSYQWLERYFSYFANKYGEISISHFRPEWNPQTAAQAFRSIAKDAIGYDHRKFGIRDRGRTVNDQDFDDPRMARAHKKTK
jgi:hypothetical protein